MLNKTFLILAVIFLTSLSYFILNNRYYNPAEVVVQTRGSAGTQATFYWDSGIGFNDRESARFTPYPEEPFEDKVHRVVITRLDESNRKSLGMEVYIEKIYIDSDENNIVDIKKLIIPGRTFIHRNHRLAFTGIGTSIGFSEEFKALNIVFYTNKSSGKVKVTIDDRSQIIDLYSEGTRTDTFTFLKDALTTTIEHEFPLPQLKIKALKIQFSTPNAVVDSLKVITKNGTISLRPDRSANSSTYIYRNLDLGTSSFNIILFMVQLFTALTITWLIYEILKHIKKLNQLNLKALANYVFLQNKHYVFWMMFSISFITFLLWLLGQWPGVMTVDSYHYTWREIKTLTFHNITPWVYNFYVLALTQFYDSPASIALFQIFVTSLLGSIIFYYSYKQGASKWIVIFSYLFFIFSIPVGVYNITLWKDIPFNTLMVFWGAFISYLFYSKKYRGISVSLDLSKIVVISFLFIFLIFLRHNGLIFLPIIPAVIFSFNLFNRKNFYQFLAVSTIIFIAVTIINSILVKTDPKEVRKLYSMSYKVMPLAAIYSSQSYYSPSFEKDKEYINKWVSDNDLKNEYTPVPQAESFEYFLSRWAALPEEEQAHLRYLYYVRSLQNLHIFLANRLTLFLGTMGFSRNIFITANELDNSSDRSIWRPLETYRFTNSSKIKGLNKLQNSVIKIATSFKGEVPVSMIIFNTFPIMIIYLIVLFLYRWFPVTALYSFIFLYNLPFLFIILFTCEWRFLYFLQLSSYFIFPLLSLEKNSSKSSARTQNLIKC